MVRVMTPNVIDIGFSALETDGKTRASGTTTHKMDLLKIIDRYDISFSSVGKSSASTSSENAGIFEDPFENHHHWPCNMHRMDLAFKDHFKKSPEAIQIVDIFIKISTFLSGN